MPDIVDIQSKLQHMDDRQRADHDMLITVNTKMDAVLQHMIDLKDGFNQRLLEVESRIKYFNDLEIALNPKKMKEDLDKVVDWKDKFGFTWKIVVFSSSAISAVIGFILAVISQVSPLFGHR